MVRKISMESEAEMLPNAMGANLQVLRRNGQVHYNFAQPLYFSIPCGWPQSAPPINKAGGAHLHGAYRL
jgi:hypothetical protein